MYPASKKLTDSQFQVHLQNFLLTEGVQYMFNDQFKADLGPEPSNVTLRLITVPYYHKR